MGAEAEKAGIPAVSIVAPQFAPFARTAARAQGVADINVCVMPYNVMNGQEPNAEPACEKATQDIIFGLTQWAPQETKTTKMRQSSLVFSGASYEEALDNLHAQFMSNMWTDGLPVFAPTRERVDWMLTGTDLSPDTVITNKLPPRKGAITVETIAINAAMAGARPEYMPILLAAVEAFASDDGMLLMNYLAVSASNAAPVLIVNGPIRAELDINSSYGLMGPGRQSNATIGRALSLLFINGAGTFSGPGGHLSSQSIPGRFSWCFAENEEQNPWSSFHQESGFQPEHSTVSVALGKGTHLIFLQPPAERILNMLSHALVGVGAREYAVPWDSIAVLAPAHAQALADAGYTKQDVQQYVFEHGRISLEEGERTGFIFRHSPEWAKRVEAVADKKNTMIPKLANADNLRIVVAGGPGCISSTLIPGSCKPVTNSVDKYKPQGWQQLLENAKQMKGPGRS